MLATVCQKISPRSGPQPRYLDFTDCTHLLRSLASSLIPNEASMPRRLRLCTVTNSENVLINHKTISELINWKVGPSLFFKIDDMSRTRTQVHAALPACFATRYPRFLCADCIGDSRYAAKDRYINRYPEIGQLVRKLPIACVLFSP